MEVKAVVNVPGIHVRHIIVVIRRYSSCWLERSPPMATDIYKSTTRHAFVVSSFVELPPGARHRCVLPFTDHTLRTLRLTHHGTGAARGKVGPWCDHVKTRNGQDYCPGSRCPRGPKTVGCCKACLTSQMLQSMTSPSQIDQSGRNDRRYRA